MQAARAAVIARIKAGEFEESRGKFGTKKFIVTLAKPVGMAYNSKAGKMEHTSKIAVVNSKKDGYHIYPQGE